MRKGRIIVSAARDCPKGGSALQTSVENLKKGRIVKDDQGCHLINIFMAEATVFSQGRHSSDSALFAEVRRGRRRGAQAAV